jgi:hypothetical protein
MNWFSRLFGPPSQSNATARVTPDPSATADAGFESPCSACGRPLDGDPEESEEAGLPICAECERARNFDADMEMWDAADGRLDGHWDG